MDPFVAVMKVGRVVCEGVLETGLVVVDDGAAADRRRHDTFSKRRGQARPARGDGSGEKLHIDPLSTLKLCFGGREASGDLVTGSVGVFRKQKRDAPGAQSASRVDHHAC